MTFYSTLLLLFCLAGLVNSARNNSATDLKPNERFRRLIPYMTFYFAQQSYGSQPQFQQHSSPTALYPISNNLPQYPSNLVVPTTYLIRANPLVSKRPQPAHTYKISTTAPTTTFGTNEAMNYNTLINNDTPTDSQLQSYQQVKPYHNERYTTLRTPAQSIEARTNALIRILSILQQTRQQPQAVATGNTVQTLAQILTVLQQANQLPTDTQSTVSKLLTQIPHYYKQPQASDPDLKVPGTNTKILQILHSPNSARKPVIPIIVAKQPFATTTLQSTQDINLLQNYKLALPKFQPAVTISHPSSIPNGYTATPIPVSTTPTPVPNDLQNYDYPPINIANIKVVPNGEPSISPLAHNQPTTTSLPPLPEPPLADLDNLQPYVYAKKVPENYKPHYTGGTVTQSFPDPNSEGSTPGRPGIDYPTYSSIPQTSFTCKTQRYKGFFGDPETSCQVWHYCDLNGGQASFLCPNGTIFSQVGLTCDWWFNVRCDSTPQLYVLNERLYKYILPVMPSFPEDYTGPLVDQYLTLKFQEQEAKKKQKDQEKTTTTETPDKDLH